MGYSKKALINIGWSGLLRIFLRILTFAKLALLARILSPSDFGAVGIATLVLAFLETLTETGVNVFLIQEKGKINSYLNTAFIISILRGILISLVIFISAPYISSFFNSENSLQLIFLISVAVK